MFNFIILKKNEDCNHAVLLANLRPSRGGYEPNVTHMKDDKCGPNTVEEMRVFLTNNVVFSEICNLHFSPHFVWFLFNLLSLKWAKAVT